LSESSSLHLLLDQGLPRDAAALLRTRDLHCTHVGEIGLSEARDEWILQWARERGWIVVTLDADFHTILMVQRAISPSVIRIRLEGLQSSALVALIVPVVEKYCEELQIGAMVTVKKRKTTCHLLGGQRN
jgi:predicted nuclease of predicted toxin-antitoxin system